MNKFNILDIFMINLLILLFIFDFVVLGGVILGAYLITKIEKILIIYKYLSKNHQKNTYYICIIHYENL